MNPRDDTVPDTTDGEIHDVDRSTDGEIGDIDRSTDEEMRDVDRSTLAPLVQRALNSSTAQIDHWACQPVHRGFGGAHLYRVSGTTRDRARSRPWSLFLKIVRPVENFGDTESWIREVRAYQSGFLEDLPGGLAAPRCFAVVERSPDEFWIWLEDVKDCIGFCTRLSSFRRRYVTWMPFGATSLPVTIRTVRPKR